MKYSIFAYFIFGLMSRDSINCSFPIWSWGLIPLKRCEQWEFLGRHHKKTSENWFVRRKRLIFIGKITNYLLITVYDDPREWFLPVIPSKHTAERRIEYQTRALSPWLISCRQIWNQCTHLAIIRSLWSSFFRSFFINSVLFDYQIKHHFRGIWTSCYHTQLGRKLIFYLLDKAFKTPSVGFLNCASRWKSCLSRSIVRADTGRSAPELSYTLCG